MNEKLIEIINSQYFGESRRTLYCINSATWQINNKLERKRLLPDEISEKLENVATCLADIAKRYKDPEKALKYLDRSIEVALEEIDVSRLIAKLNSITHEEEELLEIIRGKLAHSGLIERTRRIIFGENYKSSGNFGNRGGYGVPDESPWEQNAVRALEECA